MSWVKCPKCNFSGEYNHISIYEKGEVYHCTCGSDFIHPKYVNWKLIIKMLWYKLQGRKRFIKNILGEMK